MAQHIALSLSAVSKQSTKHANGVCVVADGIFQRCHWSSCSVCTDSAQSGHDHDDEHIGLFPMIHKVRPRFMCVSGIYLTQPGLVACISFGIFAQQLDHI